MAEVKVYIAKFHKDRKLQKEYVFPAWQQPIQVGAALTDTRVAEVCDNAGDNISVKNKNYCELTALYWIWKNCIVRETGEGKRYYGLFHYRRILDLKQKDLNIMIENEVDAVLPFPMMCEPDIREHYKRYLKEADWNAMSDALFQLQPGYAEAFKEICRQPYMYNYNMIVAKEKVLEDYCSWLFPILERTEELSIPKGSDRADRYIGYLGEHLLTLYFMFHQKDLKIYHTGRIMLL